MKEKTLKLAQDHCIGFENCLLFSGSGSTKWEKYVILTCLVFSHLQIRVNTLKEGLKLTVVQKNDRKPWENYYATLMVMFAESLDLVTFKDPKRWKKRQQLYRITAGHVKLISVYDGVSLSDRYKQGRLCTDESIDRYISFVWGIDHHIILEAINS